MALLAYRSIRCTGFFILSELCRIIEFSRTPLFVSFVQPCLSASHNNTILQHDDDPQKILARNVNERLSNAMQELRVKHERGTNERDDPDRAPTGSAYQTAASMQQQQVPHPVTPSDSFKNTPHNTQNLRQNEEAEESEDEDDYDWLLDEEVGGGDDPDEDPIFEALREKRLRELQAIADKKAADLARGHGQVRTITQDEFLPECTGSSEFVVCHFFHREFQRCAILDKHLLQIAPQHTECKVLRIDAEKAPFFVHKLQIRTLPTLLVLRHGKVVDRLVGFEGLVNADTAETTARQPSRHFSERPDADPDVWETSALQTWLAKTGAIQYQRGVAREEPEIRRQRLHGCLKRGGGGTNYEDDDEY